MLDSGTKQYRKGRLGRGQGREAARQGRQFAGVDDLAAVGFGAQAHLPDAAVHVVVVREALQKRDKMNEWMDGWMDG